MAPLQLSAREWLALFPQPASPSLRAPLVPAAGDSDPAAELRKSEPLTRDALRAALRKHPAAALLSSFQATITPGQPLVFVLLLCVQLLLMVNLAPIFVFNGRGTLFPQSSLTVSAVGILVIWVPSSALTIGVLLRAHRRVRQGVPSDASTLSYAGTARWIQLAKVDDGSVLIKHEDSDPLCPCPRKTCAGTIPDRAAASDMAFVVGAHFLLETFVLFATSWTPLVTFGSSTWTTPWSAVFAFLFLASIIAFECFSSISLTVQHHPPLALSTRLRGRAMRVLLRDLVARSGRGEVPTSALAEPYFALHASLARIWASFLADASTVRRYMSTISVLYFLAAVIFAASSSCLPAFLPVALLFNSLFILRDLTLVAYFNSGISSVRELCAAAALHLRAMGTEAAVHHAEVLRLLAADDVRGRWLGGSVDASTVRTAAVTGFTVAVGVWTLARGAGVAVVLDTVCGGVAV
ncbi:hypothetical protein DFJ74DRAFT_771871 [Hyaloraphidium curvatum]|nr:hypothetical protein DFJ74DRAFT_771871 [Hyaloraphidium curvatum]